MSTIDVIHYQYIFASVRVPQWLSFLIRIVRGPLRGWIPGSWSFVIVTAVMETLYLHEERALCVWIGNASEDSIDVTNEEPLTPQRSGCTQLPPVLPSLYSPASAETVYETSARLLFMAVKWAKNLPSFAGLPFRDQVTIVPNSSIAIRLYLNM